MDSSLDIETVATMLGRKPRGPISIVVRGPQGDPVVIKNFPILNSGEPMPTLFWLISPDLVSSIGTLESSGGVKRSELDVDSDALASAHNAYAKNRDQLLPTGYVGHKPTGGVGGTSRGVKCLHAHYGYFLTGAPDPVGAWTHSWLVDNQKDIGCSVVEDPSWITP